MRSARRVRRDVAAGAKIDRHSRLRADRPPGLVKVGQEVTLVDCVTLSDEQVQENAR